MDAKDRRVEARKDDQQLKDLPEGIHRDAQHQQVGDQDRPGDTAADGVGGQEIKGTGPARGEEQVADKLGAGDGDEAECEGVCGETQPQQCRRLGRRQGPSRADGNCCNSSSSWSPACLASGACIS